MAEHRQRTSAAATILGWLCVAAAALLFGLGMLGLFLPLLPTTPLMLAALALASRGSPRFARWIRANRYAGPVILDWERERAITRRSKIVALAMIALSVILVWWHVDYRPLTVAVTLGLFFVALFVVTRAEPHSRNRIDSNRSSAQPHGHDNKPHDSAPTEDHPMHDMKQLDKLETLNASAKDGMEAFWAFDKAAFAPGAIDAKTKQLIALATALTTQCPYCIELHTDAARDAGASNDELGETAVVAAAIRAGGAITHATHMYKK